jgi:hypothetical protein
MQALAVVQREEENEARAQQEEADRQIGNDNTAAYQASRAMEDAAENARNLAEITEEARRRRAPFPYD